MSFLVDTGASRTLIGPADARNMGIDVASLGLDREQIHGVSGVEWCYRAEAYLAFAESDRQRLHYYPIDVLISARSADEVERLPSLLARDILNRWSMHYVGHNPGPSLTFEIGSDDDHLVLDLEPR